jgi:hypothetical protein
MHILILGGYGNFGGILSRSLSVTENIRLTIAGRSQEKALRFIQTNLQYAIYPVCAATIDVHDPNLCARLSEIAPDLVIHTSGPFQGQDYHVAISCINAGVHYIDLADARRFVENFQQLDTLAKEKNVLTITGASTVPALSSAIIQHFLPKFQAIESIEYAISPGNQTDRGEATVRAILSYTGKPFTTLLNGKVQPIIGWQNLHKTAFAQPLGKRWLANCDIPDLSLFQATYPTLKTQRFYAGLELGILHIGLWGLSWFVRMGIIKNLAYFTKPIIWLSEQFLKFGSQNGGMLMILSGQDHHNRPLTIRWDLVALDNHGPMIPIIPALVLAQKMALGKLTQRGAVNSMNLMTLEEFNTAVQGFNIKQSTHYHDSSRQ